MGQPSIAQSCTQHLPPPLFGSSFFSDSEAGTTILHQAVCVSTGEGPEQRDPGTAKHWPAVLGPVPPAAAEGRGRGMRNTCRV